MRLKKFDGALKCEPVTGVVRTASFRTAMFGRSLAFAASAWDCPNEQSMPVASRGQDGRTRDTIAYSPSPEKVATIVAQPKGSRVSSTNSACV